MAVEVGLEDEQREGRLGERLVTERIGHAALAVKHDHVEGHQPHMHCKLSHGQPCEWGDALATSRRGRGIACLHVICPLSADRVLREKHLVSRTDCAAEHADATRVCAQIGT